jgi:hypothetical protein
MNSRLFKLFLFLLVLCTGCADQVYKAYDGGEKSSDELAVIKPFSTGGIRGVHAEILGVDDDYFDGSLPERVEILPGKHSVLIRCGRGRLVFEDNDGLQDRQGSVEFTARAGRKYMAVCSINKNSFLKWITDLASDEIVGVENQ